MSVIITKDLISLGMRSQLLLDLCGYRGLNEGLQSQQAVVKITWQSIAQEKAYPLVCDQHHRHLGQLTPPVPL